MSRDPRVINDQFKQYVVAIRTYLDVDTNSFEISSFLDSLDAPKLVPDAQSSLEHSLSPEEIVNAIKLSRTGGALGPDGFPIEFCREFSSKLVPVLQMA